ncbi:MAG TPA: EVE domain-containing protein [Nitrososphaera sp.]|nr:EVE domain-containing protein [Nitrososphaera sp.]
MAGQSSSVSYWLFKQEPSAYNYSQLEKDGKTVWDGVANNLALKHLRSVKKGDRALFYHTGDERQAVGIMEIVSDPYPDLKDKSLIVVDVRAAGRLKKPVTLEQIKGDPAFAQWELVRISRLSVMPVPEKLWDKIIKMSG